MLGCSRKATAPTAIDKEKGMKATNSNRIIRDNDTDRQVIIDRLALKKKHGYNNFVIKCLMINIRSIGLKSVSVAAKR